MPDESFCITENLCKVIPSIDVVPVIDKRMNR